MHLQPAPHPPYTPSGLIRPIGVSAQQTPTMPANPAPPDVHIPAHLLALSPAPSDSSTSSNTPIPSGAPFSRATPQAVQAPQPVSRPAHQFIASKEEAHKASPEQHMQRNPAQPHATSSSTSVQIQLSQLSQLSQPRQSSQTYHSSNPHLDPRPESLALEHRSSQASIEIVKGNHRSAATYSSSGQPIEAIENEGFIATSAAAEHWRTSWRKRQLAEGSSATTVSRGQSLVSEPRMNVQQSLQRTRTIIRPRPEKESTGLGFWITLFFIVCTSSLLGVYILTSFLPRADEAAHRSAPLEAPPPVLMIQGTPIAAITQGQFLHLHGKNFYAGDPIIFLLDTITAISGTDGREVSIFVSDQGTFNIGLPINATWSAGQHQIQAFDNKSGQSAYMHIQVNMPNASSTSRDVSLSASKLTFKAALNKGDPGEQFISLTNRSSTASILWAATIVANLDWLSVDENTTSGILQAGGTVSIGIIVSSADLTSTSKPYSGHILFTLNHSEQLTVPVELLV